MQVIKAPRRPTLKQQKNLSKTRSVFLAGTTKCNWRKSITEELSEYDVVIYDPTHDNYPTDVEGIQVQTEWELDYLTSSDVIVFHFDDVSPATQSLMELALVLGLNKKIIVMNYDYEFEVLVETYVSYFEKKSAIFKNNYDEAIKALKTLLDEFASKAHVYRNLHDHIVNICPRCGLNKGACNQINCPTSKSASRGPTLING